MTFVLVVVGLMVAVVVWFVRAGATPTDEFGNELTSIGGPPAASRAGTIARAIVLAVDATPSSVGGFQQGRYEDRWALLDIEVEGEAPFEARAYTRIPARFVPDVLPGATVAIDLQAADGSQVSVVGPGMAVPLFG